MLIWIMFDFTDTAQVAHMAPWKYLPTPELELFN